jgi:hypothetical protein
VEVDDVTSLPPSLCHDLSLSPQPTQAGQHSATDAADVGGSDEREGSEERRVNQEEVERGERGEREGRRKKKAIAKKSEVAKGCVFLHRRDVTSAEVSRDASFAVRTLALDESGDVYLDEWITGPCPTSSTDVTTGVSPVPLSSSIVYRCISSRYGKVLRDSLSGRKELTSRFGTPYFTILIERNDAAKEKWDVQGVTAAQTKMWLKAFRKFSTHEALPLSPVTPQRHVPFTPSSPRVSSPRSLNRLSPIIGRQSSHQTLTSNARNALLWTSSADVKEHSKYRIPVDKVSSPSNAKSIEKKGFVPSRHAPVTRSNSSRLSPHRAVLQSLAESELPPESRVSSSSSSKIAHTSPSNSSDRSTVTPPPLSLPNCSKVDRPQTPPTPSSLQSLGSRRRLSDDVVDMQDLKELLEQLKTLQSERDLFVAFFFFVV